MRDRLAGLSRNQRFELHRMRYERNVELWRTLSPWLGGAVLALALWLPLHELVPMVAALSGKSTTLSLNASIAWGSASVLAILAGVQSIRAGRIKVRYKKLRATVEVNQADALEESGITVKRGG
ncbi:hypothetical protein [Isoptericola sp. NPDC057191]|uniref:hypothetical protein n=1 Tax=Isoptericola sp. NPDC057191 TaxID=3346041 RepID=UPI003640CA93